MERYLKIILSVCVCISIGLGGPVVSAASKPCGNDSGDFGAGVANDNGDPVVNPNGDDDVVAATNPIATCAMNHPLGVEVCLANGLDEDPNYVACYEPGQNSYRIRSGNPTVEVTDIKLLERSPEAQTSWVNLNRANQRGMIGRILEAPQGNATLYITVNDVEMSIPTAPGETADDVSQRLLNELMYNGFSVQFGPYSDPQHTVFDGQYIMVSGQGSPPASIRSLRLRSTDPGIITATLIITEIPPKTPGL